MGKRSAALGVAILGVAGLVVPAQAADEPITFPKMYGSGRGGTINLPGTGGKCLDAALEEIDKEGGRVQMYQCTGSVEQRSPPRASWARPVCTRARRSASTPRAER